MAKRKGSRHNEEAAYLEGRAARYMEDRAARELSEDGRKPRLTDAVHYVSDNVTQRWPTGSYSQCCAATVVAAEGELIDVVYYPCSESWNYGFVQPYGGAMTAMGVKRQPLEPRISFSRHWHWPDDCPDRK